MIFSRSALTILAAGGSLAILLGAFGFQYLGGLAPCEMCLWQRWPHAAAVLIGIIAVGMGRGLWPWLGALAALSTSVIGAYHAGVEQKWWAGPSSCTGGGDLTGLSGGDLLNFNAAETIVMCDEIPWEMFGISMAGYNALISFGLAVIWVMAARKR